MSDENARDDTTESGLAAIISDYCRRCGMSEATFGTKAVRDARLVQRLTGGKTITLETRRKVLDFMADNPAPQLAPGAAA